MSEFRYTGKCYCGQALSLVTPAEKAYVRVTCPACQKSPSIPRIEGTFNPDHKCDPRCTGAKGNICSCACGGANHGSDHGNMSIVAVERPLVQGHTHRPAKHLGEVGKRITGEVTVTKRKAVSGNKFLFQFRTNDGDKITWFVPDQYAPAGMSEGDKLTIRAKVIRHEDDPQWGKATHVIFVEEV